MKTLYYSSPIDIIEIKIESEKILSIEFAKEDHHPSQSSDQIFQECIHQLDGYFKGELKIFDLPLLFAGTDFQNKVWHQLTHIAFGKTTCYSALANDINNPKAVRAVGAANGQNPFVIVVPCHRVIEKNGKLTGYGGGIWRKEWLLKHEAKFSPDKSNGKQLNLFTI